MPGVLKALSPAENSEMEMIAAIAKTGNSESIDLSEMQSEVTRSKDSLQDKSVGHSGNAANEASATNPKRKLSISEDNKDHQTPAKTGEDDDTKTSCENRHKGQPDTLAKAKVAVTVTSKEEIASTKDPKNPKEHTEDVDKEKDPLTNPAKESVTSNKTSKDNTTSTNSSKGALTNKVKNQVKSPPEAKERVGSTDDSKDKVVTTNVSKDRVVTTSDSKDKVVTMNVSRDKV